jgi:hypothetical protein
MRGLTEWLASETGIAISPVYERAADPELMTERLLRRVTSRPMPITTRIKAARATLEELGLDPLRELALLAKELPRDSVVRVGILQDLKTNTHAKLSAMDLKVEDATIPLTDTEREAKLNYLLDLARTRRDGRAPKRAKVAPAKRPAKGSVRKPR